jgi:1,4-dihydroxy-2-naphthoate octaprenyltransferase
MQILASLTLVEVNILAIVLGILFALSVRKQMVIQKRDIEIDRAGGKTSLFVRMMHAGLSFAIATFAVVASKYVPTLRGYDFLLVFLIGAFATWLALYLNYRWQRKNFK